MIISVIWTLVLLVCYSIKSTLRQMRSSKIEAPWNRWFKSSLDKSYEVIYSKQYLNIGHVNILKTWTAGLPVWYSEKSNLRKKGGLNMETTWNWWFQLILEKSYALTNSKCEHFAISPVTISPKVTVALTVWHLQNTDFNIQKKPSSLVKFEC